MANYKNTTSHSRNEVSNQNQIEYQTQNQSMTQNPRNAAQQNTFEQQIQQQLDDLRVSQERLNEDMRRLFRTLEHVEQRERQIEQVQRQLLRRPRLESLPSVTTEAESDRLYEPAPLEEVVGFVEILEDHVHSRTAHLLPMDRFPDEAREELLHHRGSDVSERTTRAFEMYDQYMSERNGRLHQTTLPVCTHQHSPSFPAEAGSPEHHGGINGGINGYYTWDDSSVDA